MSDRPSSDAHDSPRLFFAKRFIFTSTDGAPFEFIATARGHATAAARSSFNILLQLFRGFVPLALFLTSRRLRDRPWAPRGDVTTRVELKLKQTAKPVLASVLHAASHGRARPVLQVGLRKSR